MSTKASAKNAVQFGATFNALRTLVTPYQDRLVIKTDQAGNYTAELPQAKAGGDASSLAFSLLITRTHVAFHFYPVYAFPDLLKNISPKLRKHMDDRTGWSFKQPDDKLFGELAELVAAGFSRYEEAGFL